MCVAQNIRLDNGKPDKIISGPSGQYYDTALLRQISKSIYYSRAEITVLQLRSL